jgi:DNA polymerase III subunit delta'
MTELVEQPEISLPLPWHAGEWALLNRELAAGRLPHALLLVGRQYTGKSQLAIALSRLLLCAQPEDNVNCGRCHACELSASGGHGDFRWVMPGEKSRVIKIDQIRDMLRFSNKTAGFGLRKVIVLSPADSMNINAFNALLKLLEEPPKDTHIILVCNRLYGIPATIRSRCHILRLPVPDQETALSWLDRGTGQRDRSEKLLSLSDGLPMLARELDCSGGVDHLAARRASLQGLLTERVTVNQACVLWGELDVGEFLEALTLELQRALIALPQLRLRTRRSQSLFQLLDEISELRRAVSAGANPGKQLLVEALLSKVRRSLGGLSVNGSILPHRGEGSL